MIETVTVIGALLVGSWIIYIRTIKGTSTEKDLKDLFRGVRSLIVWLTRSTRDVIVWISINIVLRAYRAWKSRQNEAKS